MKFTKENVTEILNHEEWDDDCFYDRFYQAIKKINQLEESQELEAAYMLGLYNGKKVEEMKRLEAIKKIDILIKKAKQQIEYCQNDYNKDKGLLFKGKVSVAEEIKQILSEVDNETS